MSPLPFEHFDDPSLDSKVSSEEQLQWEETQAFVDRLITSDLVRGLSRYALPQMETYNYHPSEKTALRVIGTHQESVLYEVTLDELPSHSKLVTRHLKLYIVGLRYENQFLPNHFYLTIRGERFE
jgi:hypothetical protein